MKTLRQIFKFLIEHNLDPRQLWAYSKSGISPLPFLSVFSYLVPPEFTPLLLDLARDIIHHSIQDTYYQVDFTEIVFFQKSVLRNTRGAVSALVMNPEYCGPDLDSSAGCSQSISIESSLPLTQDSLYVFH
jgi:hypothetical protein